MGIMSWLVVGLLAGALGKWIMPGKDPGGIFVTMLIGIAGGIVGGFIGGLIGLGGVTGFNFGTLLTATGGAVLLLFLYRQFKKNGAEPPAGD
ncbi:MAG: GlsB/YeaQ/YmgE family stress response membrane protein [Gammaproteobacteria bacterium]|nr:GlsB/YeaQ/YmgE family stress response membrane protein [Gammaproteobacteria bacterium]